MFHGVIPILATPFDDEERIDLESWERMIEFMMRLEVDAVTILGVLGESNRLSDRERETLIGSAIAVVDSRVPVIVGSSHSGTQAAPAACPFFLVPHSTRADRRGKARVHARRVEKTSPPDNRDKVCGFVRYERRGNG